MPSVAIPDDLDVITCHKCIDEMVCDECSQMENDEMDKYPPTPEEFRQYLKDHNLNGVQVAEMLHVTRRSVGHWMAGNVRLPWSVWHTLRTIVEGASPVSEA